MPVPRERPFFSNLPLWEILVAWLRHSSSKSSVTHPYQCVQCFHSSNPPFQCVQCFHSSKQSTAALPILPVCALFSFVQTINSSVTHPTSVCSVSIRSTLPASVCNVSIRPINQPQSPAPDLVPISTQQWRRLESHGYLNVLTTFRNIVCHIAPFLDSGREQSFSERRPVC